MENPRNWSELAAVWKDAMRSDAYIRATGGVPESDIPAPHGLIDVSGGRAGVGSKMMAGKLASLGNKSRKTANAWTRKPDPALINIERNIAMRDAAINTAQNQQRIGNTAAASAFMVPDLIEVMK